MRKGLRCALLALAPLILVAGGAAQEQDEAWLQKRLRQIKDSDTIAWRQVPWEGSLLEAEAVGRREKRPVFAFTLDGNLDTGRC